MQLTTFSYRFGSEVLDSAGFLTEKRDVVEIFTAINDVPSLAKPKVRTRKNKRTGAIKSMTFTTSQKALNILLDSEFDRRKWACQPLVTDDKITNIKADYKRGRVQVEVQFGNMARWYTDVFKFQVSYSLGLIDVGVLVVPMQRFANTID
jgi:hypothetical protein